MLSSLFLTLFCASSLIASRLHPRRTISPHNLSNFAIIEVAPFLASIPLPLPDREPDFAEFVYQHWFHANQTLNDYDMQSTIDKVLARYKMEQAKRDHRSKNRHRAEGRAKL